jgi:AcrR family transcriptional regulator
MRAKKVETEVRQDQIAQAALSVIGRHGLKGLNLARVARQVGFVPSAIYRHFDGKDGVLDAVLDLIRDRLFGNVDAVCRKTPEPMEQLHRLLLRHVQLIRENQGIPRIIFSDEMYIGHPERRAKVYAIISGYLKRVAELIRRGQQSGRCPIDCPPDVLAVMFLGLIQPSVILWHVSAGAFDVIKQTKRAWRVVCTSLRGQGRRSHERGPCSGSSTRRHFRKQGVRT